MIVLKDYIQEKTYFNLRILLLLEFQAVACTISSFVRNWRQRLKSEVHSLVLFYININMFQNISLRIDVRLNIYFTLASGEHIVKVRLE